MTHIPTINFKDSHNNTYSVRITHNQKMIYIHRSRGIDFTFNRRAIKSLSSDAYVLYSYLLLNQPERIWALSSQHVYESTPLKKRTYTKAIQELLEKGYLTAGEFIDQDNNKHQENTYHFWEDPSLSF